MYGERVSVIKLAIQYEAHRTIVLASPQKNKENEWYSPAHITIAHALFSTPNIEKCAGPAQNKRRENPKENNTKYFLIQF